MPGDDIKSTMPLDDETEPATVMLLNGHMVKLPYIYFCLFT